MAKKNPSKYKTKILRGIARADVPAKEYQLMMDPLYVSHKTLPEGNDRFTIIVILRRS